MKRAVRAMVVTLPVLIVGVARVDAMPSAPVDGRPPAVALRGAAPCQPFVPGEGSPDDDEYTMPKLQTPPGVPGVAAATPADATPAAAAPAPGGSEGRRAPAPGGTEGPRDGLTPAQLGPFSNSTEFGSEGRGPKGSESR